MIILTKIYFVRHCEAQGNVQRIFQGTTDTDISELGAKQLECLRKRFKDIKLDKIYSSPLIRAVKTAEAINGDKGLVIEKLRGLIELDGGIVEGKPFAEAFSKIPGLVDTWNNHPQDFAPQYGEPMRHAYERIYNTLRYVFENNKGKTVACTTHGGVTRCLLCRLLKGDIEQLKEIPWSDNTAVALLEIDDNFNVNIAFYNDASHLPEQLLPTRNRIVSYMKEE